MALIADAALGSVISELLKVVIIVSKQTLNFKSNLETLKKTLNSVQPIFDEIEKLHKVLERPEEQTQHFIKQLQSGADLVAKCSTIPYWNVYKTYVYSKKLVDLEKSVLKFFEIQVQGLVGANNLNTVIES